MALFLFILYCFYSRLSVACESDTPKRNERDRRKILSTLVNEPLRFDGEDIENSQEKENTGLESPVEVNSDSKKYLDALDSYVNTILESEEKDQLLDLKYFDKEVSFFIVFLLV